MISQTSPQEASASPHHAPPGLAAIPFEDLKEAHYAGMRRLFAAASLKDAPFDSLQDFFRDAFLPGLGRVFFVYEGEKTAGFAICFDSPAFKQIEKLSPDLRNFLKYGHWFLKEMAHIGKYCFINLILIDKPYRGCGMGSQLLQGMSAFYQQKSRKAILIGTILPHAYFDTLHLLKKNGYLFIDHYQNGQDGPLLSRAVKILNKQRFNQTIGRDILPHAFRTIIPIQLSASAQSINELIKEMDAEILWAAFFQNDRILPKEFDLHRIYMGFYGPLLESKKRENFEFSLQVLKMLLHYFEAMDDGTDSKVASLTRSMMSRGYELFLINDETEKHDFPSFSTPVVFNIHDMRLEKLLATPEMKLGEPLLRKEISQWRKLLNKKALSGRGKWKAEEEVQWRKWMEKLRLSPQKEVRLIRLTRQYASHPEALSEEDQQALNRIEGYRKIGPQEAAKWETWIANHVKLAKNAALVYGPAYTWCHAVVPISFSRGVKRIIFSFIVKAGSSRTKINYLANVISDALSKNMFNIMLKLDDIVIKKYLVRNAISRVMTRNMAHNIASHILSRVSSKYVIEELVKGFNPYLDTLDLAKFNDYLRTRMDFLADISTTEPVIAIRKKINHDILQKFNQEEIILSFIGGIDKKCGEVLFRNEANALEDIQIQVPNGELGNHALYIIMENIIRNSCKHSNLAHTTGGQPLTLSVVCKEEMGDGRYYKVLIHDNVERQVEAGESREEDIVEKINTQFIDIGIIDENNQLRPNGWGILEMKIAASYLRKLTLEAIDGKFSPPLLKAVKVPHPSDAGRYYLGYELYLKKPREVLVIDHEAGILQPGEHYKRISHGVKVVSKKWLQDDPYNIFSHEFVLNLGKLPRKAIETQKRFPLRWLSISDEEKIQSICQLLHDDPEALILNCWSRWYYTYKRNKRMYHPLKLYLRLRDQDFESLARQQLARSLVFDLHGHLVHAPPGSPGPAASIHPADCCYYEAFKTQSPTGLLMAHYSKEPREAQVRLHWELKEAAITRVLVLDERIQKKASEMPSYLEPLAADYLEELKWANVVIPRPDEIDLYANDYGPEKCQRIYNWIAQQLRQEKVDFIIVHLGIIEKMEGSTAREVNAFIEHRIRAHGPRVEVILTSGRGKPHEISEEVLFLHFSNVAKFILQEKSKYHLCKVLFSARTRIRVHV